MELTLEKVKGWKDAPVKSGSKDYPQCPNKDLPRCFFIASVFGQKGSGKTVAVANLIKQYELSGIWDPKYKEWASQRVIMICPTDISANPCYDELKYFDQEIDLHKQYSDEMMEIILKDILEQKRLTIQWKDDEIIYQKIMKKIKPYVLKWDFLGEKDYNLTDEEMEVLERHVPGNEPKYLSRCVVHLICDDLVGSDAFKMGRNYLTNIALRSRHCFLNMYFLVQTVKNAIPTQIKLNSTVIIIFRFADRKKLIEDVSECASSLLTPKQFEQVYDYALGEYNEENRYNFLYLDTNEVVNRQIRKRFDEFILFNRKKNLLVQNKV